MDKKTRILIFEDNISDAELIKRQLRKSDLDFVAATASDKDSFASALDTFVPDLILADYSVPGFDGLAALNLARRRIADIPVIIVSGAIGEEFAVEILKAGATDYVLKDGLTRLGPAIKRAIKEAINAAERKSLDEQISHLATFPEFNPNPIIETTLSGKVTYLNHAFEKVFPDIGDVKSGNPVLRNLRPIIAELRETGKRGLCREIKIGEAYYEQLTFYVKQNKRIRHYLRDITESKRSEEVLSSRLKIIETTSDRSVSIDESLVMILDEVEKHTGSKIGFYHFVDTDQETLTLQAWSTNTIKNMCSVEAKGAHYPISQAGVWVDCIHERKPVIHNNYATLSHGKGLPKGHAPVIRELVVPIFRDEKIMAIVGVGNKPTDYNSSDIEVASLLGDVSWEIVRRKKAEEAEKKAQIQAMEELEISNLLLEAADALSSTTEMPRMLESLVDIIHEVSGRSRVYVSMVDRKNDQVVVAAVRGALYVPVGGTTKFGDTTAAVRQAITENRWVIADVSEPGISAKDKKILESTHCKLSLFVPIARQLILEEEEEEEEEVFAYIGVDEPDVRKEFSARDISLISGITDQAAIAIENARLFANVRQEKELSDALNEISAIINSKMDFDEIGQEILEKAAKTVGVEAALIALSDDKGWYISRLFGMDKDFLGFRISDENAAPTLMALEGGDPIIVNDASHDERLDRELMGTFKLGSLIIAPLSAKKKIIGGLALGSFSPDTVFDDAQLDFAKKLAASVSLAVENSRLFRNQQHIADTLQGALLTFPETIDGIEFGYLYRSATEEARVGGDFYDLFELEGDKVGIVIGDVSGKGVEAATITARVKNTIRAYVYRGDSPATVMTGVNQVIAKTSEQSQFVTTFFGVLEKSSGILTYCSAGHPPAIIKRKKAKPSFLGIGSPLVGAIAALNYVEDTVTLEQGDCLVLYTDGITEARRNDGEFFGDRRLLKLVGDLKQATVKELTDSILSKVEDFAGGKLQDDLALLILRLE